MDNLIASLASSEPPQTSSQPTVTSSIEPTPIHEPTVSAPATTTSTSTAPTRFVKMTLAYFVIFNDQKTKFLILFVSFVNRSTHEIAFESAQQKLSTLKWQLARPLGPPQQKDLISYIRIMIEKVKYYNNNSQYNISIHKFSQTLHFHLLLCFSCYLFFDTFSHKYEFS
jgi:hypothetical protein